MHLALICTRGDHCGVGAVESLLCGLVRSHRVPQLDLIAAHCATGGRRRVEVAGTPFGLEHGLRVGRTILEANEDAALRLLELHDGTL